MASNAGMSKKKLYFFIEIRGKKVWIVKRNLLGRNERSFPLIFGKKIRLKRYPLGHLDANLN